MDRIDLHVNVPSLDERELGAARPGESSSVVRERVMRARARQLERQRAPNARLAGRDLQERARASAAARNFLLRASAAMGLSARAHQRVLKVARTIADLEGNERVGEAHVAEALGYR